ncbi:MAG: hypothetical protein GXY83_09350 [Rhodopirellula sp.]|nr:hypothetical protein [Rhodopirellula sp.]
MRPTRSASSNPFLAIVSAIMVCLFSCVGHAESVPREWQNITVPKVEEVAASFASPPAEYSLTMWWFWNGEMTESIICRDLADLKSHGIGSVMIWPYNGLTNLEYLSPEWFDRVKYAVHEAGRLGLRIWIMDEGCYPSGFVGGKVTRERPQQRMQVLAEREISPGHLEVKPEYRTSATRYIHAPGFRKDATYSLFDALNPTATTDFLTDVHEQYWASFGDEFGRTVLGIMGDEPSFPGVPYTEAIFDDFARRKGYDIRPHLAQIFTKNPGDDARRIRADYWDVWTDLYRDHFFQPQADWCARHGVEFLMHLCGEEDMPTLVALNGDFFKCMRPVQVPGVDAIWRQIWPGKVADYSKLASSVAHLRGRPRAFCEAYAVYGRGLSVEQAKWVLDHLLARGINLIQAMSYLSSRETFRPYFCPPDLNLSPQWPHFSALFAYANRMSYLLSVGEPTASIAVYYPTTSGWLGDFSANETALALAQHLLENQCDFDFVDEESLQSGLKLETAAMVNASGQRYRTVIVPAVKAISRTALQRLEEFAASGGRVVFVEHLPDLVVGQTFLHAADGPKHLPWAAIIRPADSLQMAASLLPEPDLVVKRLPEGGICPAVKYVHRRLEDGEIYFLFNESAETLEASVRLQGEGAPQFWNARTGFRSRPLDVRREGNCVHFALRLEPNEARTIVLGPAPREPLPVEPLMRPTSQSIVLDGDWNLTIGERPCRGPLKRWSEYGEAGFSGTVRYARQFTVPETLSRGNGSVYLDLGDVKYSARAVLNGIDLGTLAWRPFRWNVDEAIRTGANTLEVEVTNTAANELAGDPQRLADLRERGWLQNSYIQRYLPFDEEMVPSGLLGPARLAVYEKIKSPAE